MPRRPIRVLVADDQPVFRNGLRSALSSADDIEVLGEAEHGREAIQQARLLRPDVVLMDISMPQLDGVEATRVICSDERLADLRVLILSVCEEDDYVFEALRAGASGFLTKVSSSAKILEGIRLVAGGSAILAPPLTRKLIAEFVRRPARLDVSTRRLATFTERELDVFRLLVGGYRNDEIADELVVGESTVKSHVQHIYQKLQVRDRVQVVIYAYEHGLLQPGMGLVSPGEGR
jgi:DNA-binding NarL/FixJ family response regulator